MRIRAMIRIRIRVGFIGDQAPSAVKGEAKSVVRRGLCHRTYCTVKSARHEIIHRSKQPGILAVRKSVSGSRGNQRHVVGPQSPAETERRTRPPTLGVLSALAWLLVSLFFLLPPPAAWRFGALSPRLMGLTGIGWVGSLRAGAPLMFLIIGLLIFGWLVYRRSLTGDRTRTRVERVGATLRAPVDAALLQWHWAFYRALAIALLPIVAGALANSEILRPLGSQLLAAPLYWGSWLGLALIALEWALNPFGRAGLQTPRSARNRAAPGCAGHCHDRPLHADAELLAPPDRPPHDRDGDRRLVTFAEINKTDPASPHGKPGPSRAWKTQGRLI